MSGQPDTLLAGEYFLKQKPIIIVLGGMGGLGEMKYVNSHYKDNYDSILNVQEVLVHFLI